MGKKTRATHRGDTNVLEEVALRKANPKPTLRKFKHPIGATAREQNSP